MLSSSKSLVKLDRTKDYVIELSGGRITKPVTINGGRNVVWIGGRVDVPGSDRAIYLQNQAGTVHVEGVHISGTGLKEGINLSQPDAVVQLQNIKVDTVVGSYRGHHADLVQTWNGPKELRIDRFEGATQYQGFFLAPQQFGSTTPTRFDLRNIVIRDSGGSSAYLLWQSGTFPIKTSNVTLVHPSKTVAKMVKTSGGQSSWSGVTAARSAPSPLLGTPGSGYGAGRS